MKSLKKFLIKCILIIVFLELTIFNINCYRVNFSKLEQIDYNEEKLSALEKIDSEEYKVLKLDNLNKNVKSIYIKLKNGNNVDYEIYYSDETTVGKFLGTKTYDKKVEKTKYTVIDLSREC